MNRYTAAGRSVATAASANAAGAAIWNPSSTIAINIREIHWCKTVATADHLGFAIITARGTATLTVTPDADNDMGRSKVTPVSGALIDLTYSAQPTLASPFMARWNLPAAIGSGVMYVFNGDLWIAPGTGLAIVTPQAVILQPADVTFIWEE